MRNFIEYSRLVFFITSRSVQCLPQVRRYVSNYFKSKDLLLDTCKYITFQNNETFLHKLNDICDAQETRKFSISHFSHAKEKNRGDKKKRTVKADPREMEQYLNVERFRAEMEKALETMKNDFIKNLSLRSATGSIEDVTVTFDDKEYFLQELVQVARKPNNVILNASAFPQAIPQILDALRKSGMNLNPQQDGTKIAIPIPKVTKEHREILSKNAKALFIKCRDNLKNTQNKQLKSLKNNSDITEDTFYRMKAQVEALCNQYIQEAENMLKSKQAELLGS